jgi:hypothetical protein
MSSHSPFPGLDPYLEGNWSGIHQRMITYAADALQSRLPDDLVACVEERVYVETEDQHPRTIVPDAHVAERQIDEDRGGQIAVATEIELAESLTLVTATVEITEGFIEIREAKGGAVVTVIEVLSPSNKLGGPGRSLYEQKQSEIVHSKTSLVEIDLIRTGPRVFGNPSRGIPETWKRDALVCVRKSWRPDEAELHRLPLRRPLPGVPIPLREADAAVVLDLQAIHDQCYRNGRYDRRIDYSVPPEPPLADEDAKWAKELLASAGKLTRPES